jgi:hypothetical protein
MDKHSSLLWWCINDEEDKVYNIDTRSISKKMGNIFGSISGSLKIHVWHHMNVLG